MKIHKKTIAMFLVAILLIFNLTINSHANVQSVSNGEGRGLVNKTSSQFFALIRQMESSTGPMGLNAEIDSSTGEETSQSNGIDVHMIKNTEWGAVTLLMDSDFGAKAAGTGTSLAEDVRSTTGNATGVYEMYSGWEYVAGVYENMTSQTYRANLYNAIHDGTNLKPSKYVNAYSNPTDVNTDYSGQKPGDATGETARWKSASGAAFVTSDAPVFKRGNSGAFYFFGDYGYDRSSLGSRATVVCGLRILIIH
ncbi:MAG: hypothetical protein IJJ82_06615 [Clostridia bacterium]|nr:hypothetical protein [Clostridia bacterium]